MSPPAIAVTDGSLSSRSFEHNGLRVSDVRYPPHLFKGKHLSFRSARRRCPPATAGGEPLGDAHWNRIGPQGARIVAFEVSHERLAGLEAARGILCDGRNFRHAAAADLARRAARELECGDAATPLVLESIAHELLALSIRCQLPRFGRSRTPVWLGRVQEEMHARFLEPLRSRELAAHAGVHPVHLARGFRAHLGVSPGEYQRALRLDWAAGRLATSDDPIASIALEAGFTDQSHLTRWFRKRRGLAPGEYRRVRRARGR